MYKTVTFQGHNERKGFVKQASGVMSPLLCTTRWISLHHLHGSSLMIAYERGLPLDGDWLGQRHGAVGLISCQVLQAAGIGLLLPILSEQKKKKRVHMLLSAE